MPAQAIDVRVAMVGSAGLVFYFHPDRLGPDRLGNALAMAGGTGLITDRYKYSAFGVEEPPPVSANAYRFNGRRFDPETGLYHYRARYYDPSDIGGGRFLEPDPVGYKDQMNLYAYVGNDPLNKTDPRGESCVTETGSTGELVERCIVDKGRDKLAEEHIEKFEKAYTETVARLDEAANADKKVLLEVNGKKMAIDAKGLAARLRETEVTATDRQPPPDGNTPVWRALAQMHADNEMTVFGVARNLSSDETMRLIVHEGLHGAGGYDEFTARLLGPGNFANHRGPYNKAAGELLNFLFNF